MRVSAMAATAVAVALAWLCAAQPGLAQDEQALAVRAGAPPPPAGWTVPRTPWGDPDLRGIWPIDSVGRTPVERPVQFGEQAYFTDEQYAAAIAQAEDVAAGYEREDAEGTIGSGHWFEWGRPLRQTSLIMEPANGRFPPLTEEGERMSAAMRSSWNVLQFEGIGDFNTLDRCISRGLPSSMTPFPYNNGIRVFQSPGYVVLQLEIVHETRIIRLVDGPPPPEAIRQYLGVSRGRWEGDTLVIETTNLTGETPLNIVGPGNKPLPTSPEQTVTERLTMTGPDTILYEAEISDPVVLTAPFRLVFPWSRDDDYGMFEYACHEGNTVVPYYIRSTSRRFLGELENPSDPAEWVRDTVRR